MTEMVPLSKLRDNPWRDRVRNPIDTDRVDNIVVSIEKTKRYWEGTYGRKVEGGFVELAFAHHRKDAAKKAGLKEIPITIEPFTDGEMLVWMAQENVRGELPVVLEAVHAAVQALGSGKIEIDAPTPKTKKSAIRYAPSFLTSSPAAGDHPYTAKSVANFLGYTKKSTGEPKDSVMAAFDILERAEIAAKGDGKGGTTETAKRKAAVVEQSFTRMPLKEAQKALSDIKQREALAAERVAIAKKTQAELDAEQRKAQAEARARQDAEEAKRKQRLAELAEAEREENAKKARALKAKMEAEAKAAEEKAVLDSIRISEIDAKLEAAAQKAKEQAKVDEYLPTKREAVRILHKLQGETSTTKEALAEEVKALVRQNPNQQDREQLRQAALTMGTWYIEWVAMQFLPPLSSTKQMNEYRTREAINRRAEEAKKEKLAAQGGSYKKEKNGKGKQSSTIRADCGVRSIRA